MNDMDKVKSKKKKMPHTPTPSTYLVNMIQNGNVFLHSVFHLYVLAVNFEWVFTFVGKLKCYSTGQKERRYGRETERVV